MKNRKKVVVSFLLVACMLIGIGYAALTDYLDINGSADVNQTAAEKAFDENIYFSDAVVKTGVKTGEKPDLASVDALDNDVASFTANSLEGAGDSVEFTFTITNDGDLAATVSPSLAENGNTNREYFHIESDWAGQPRRIEAGQSMTYTVTVTLLKTPTATIHGSFHIQLTAVSDDITTTTPEETTTADPEEIPEP